MTGFSAGAFLSSSITNRKDAPPSGPFRARMWAMSAQPPAPANRKPRNSSPVLDAAVSSRRLRASRVGASPRPAHGVMQLEVQYERNLETV